MIGKSLMVLLVATPVPFLDGCPPGRDRSDSCLEDRPPVGSYDVTLVEWREQEWSCQQRVAGTCGGGERLFLREETVGFGWALGGEFPIRELHTYYFDPNTRELVGYRLERDYDRSSCGGLTYWPEPIECGSEVIVEDLCAGAQPRPAWLDALIAQFQSEPVGNPPRSVYQYTYQGGIVYYVPPQCCDQFSTLYDADGNVLCAPDGGFTGTGDGRCPDFSSQRTDKVLVWEDPRR